MVATESDLCILRIDMKTKRASPKDDFRYQVVRLKHGEQIRLGPYRFSPDCLIGQPFGSMFQFDEPSRSLKPLTDQSGFDHLRHLINPTSNTEQPNKSPHSSDSESDAEPADPIQRDNRNLIPSNSNQTLAPATIAELKQSGADRSALVEQLAQGSKTFAQKSAFSQEKYLRKKQKRHAPHVALLRSCARVACEMQLAKSAHVSPHSADCAGLRVDSLALLLHYADLSASSRVLLFECGTRGLVAGAIVERIAPPIAPEQNQSASAAVPSAGFLVQIGAHRKSLGNLPAWIDSKRYSLDNLYYRIALDDLEADSPLAPAASSSPDGDGASDEPTAPKKPHLMTESLAVTDTHTKSCEEDEDDEEEPRDVDTEPVGAPAAVSVSVSVTGPNVENSVTASSSSTAVPIVPTPYARRAAVVRSKLEARRASSLVLVCRYSPPPLELARRLWRWLRPSGAFVVYCEHLPSLVELFMALRDGCATGSTSNANAKSSASARPASTSAGLPTPTPTNAADGGDRSTLKKTTAAASQDDGFAAVQLELTECFCREMQVLPARTHPHVPFHAFGGYLLTGIKILP